jgi:hypothetical protein
MPVHRYRFAQAIGRLAIARLLFAPIEEVRCLLLYELKQIHCD